MFGCLVVRPAVPVPPVLLDGLVVVVDEPGFVVVVVDAALDDDVDDALEDDDEDEDELDDDDDVDDALDDDVDEDEDDVDEEEDDCCAFGLVVDVAACVVGLESSRSPGLATASATPATRTTIAAIKMGSARDLRGSEPCWEESG